MVSINSANSERKDSIIRCLLMNAAAFAVAGACMLLSWKSCAAADALEVKAGDVVFVRPVDSGTTSYGGCSFLVVAEAQGYAAIRVHWCGGEILGENSELKLIALSDYDFKDARPLMKGAGVSDQ